MSRGIVTPDWFTDTGIVTGPAEKIIRYLAQPGICPGKPQGCPAVGDYHLWIGTPESGTMSTRALRSRHTVEAEVRSRSLEPRYDNIADQAHQILRHLMVA